MIKGYFFHFKLAPVPHHPHMLAPNMQRILPGKRENTENLLSERRRGRGDTTAGERGGVTAGGGVARAGERQRSSLNTAHINILWTAAEGKDPSL